MSNIEINDFSTEFYEDFREDVGYLADNINRTMSDMARRYGGALDDVDRYFDEHRSSFLRLFETIVGTEVINNRARIDDVLKDAILASLAVCASTVRNGNRDSDDFIAGEFDNNPFLRDLQRSSRHDDRGRDRDVVVLVMVVVVLLTIILAVIVQKQIAKTLAVPHVVVLALPKLHVVVLLLLLNLVKLKVQITPVVMKMLSVKSV